MSEKSTRIEDELLEYLDDGVKESALEFAAYLSANQMKPRMWFGPGFWIIPWENNNLFGIHLYGLNPNAHNKGWVFWFFSGDYNCGTDEELMKFVQDNVGFCVKCYSECEKQGVNMMIFGREYTNLCYQFPVRIENPDTITLEKIKKLIELWKEIAPYSNGLHVH